MHKLARNMVRGKLRAFEWIWRFCRTLWRFADNSGRPDVFMMISSFSHRSACLAPKIVSVYSKSSCIHNEIHQWTEPPCSKVWANFWWWLKTSDLPHQNGVIFSKQCFTASNSLTVEPNAFVIRSRMQRRTELAYQFA